MYCKTATKDTAFDMKLSYGNKDMRYLKVKGETKVRTQQSITHKGQTYVLQGWYGEKQEVNEHTVKKKVTHSFDSMLKLAEHFKERNK